MWMNFSMIEDLKNSDDMTERKEILIMRKQGSRIKLNYL